MGLAAEEDFILKRREALLKKAIRDLEEAAKRLEEFGYEVVIKAYKAGK